jgi:hypothetical protein
LIPKKRRELILLMLLPLQLLILLFLLLLLLELKTAVIMVLQLRQLVVLGAKAGTKSGGKASMVVRDLPLLLLLLPVRLPHLLLLELAERGNAVGGVRSRGSGARICRNIRLRVLLRHAANRRRRGA